MRTLSLIVLSLILTTPALAQMRQSRCLNAQTASPQGKFDFKEQPISCHYLQLMGELARKNFHLR